MWPFVRRGRRRFVIELAVAAHLLLAAGLAVFAIGRGRGAPRQGLDVAMQLAGQIDVTTWPVRLQGRVVLDGVPVPGARIYGTAASLEFVETARADQEGRFELRVTMAGRIPAGAVGPDGTAGQAVAVVLRPGQVASLDIELRRDFVARRPGEPMPSCASWVVPRPATLRTVPLLATRPLPTLGVQLAASAVDARTGAAIPWVTCERWTLLRDDHDVRCRAEGYADWHGQRVPKVLRMFPLATYPVFETVDVTLAVDGAHVTRVRDDEAAAGLQVGDVVIAADGVAWTGPDLLGVERLGDIVERCTPVPITVRRGDETVQIVLPPTW